MNGTWRFTPVEWVMVLCAFGTLIGSIVRDMVRSKKSARAFQFPDSQRGDAA